MYCKLALGNVRKSFKDYAIYFLTLLFGVCVFYAFNAIAQQNSVLELNQVQDQMLNLLGMLVSSVSVFIAVILGFLIVYANRFLIRRRKKEFGIYLTLGMDRGKVSRVIVLETLFVGLLSLICGIALGVAISQVMLYVTAALFNVTIDTFTFTFSESACMMTIGYFAVMFLVALVFNVITVSRYKLIDLINADRKSESVKLRSLPLSVALFIVSLVCIGVAYALLIDNGLVVMDEQLLLSTILVCIGTVLFFFSLSGFLLRVVQGSKRLYFKGLNMFTLRQINSKINTAFISIALVCMALFLAITSTCGGFAICTTMNKSLENATPYDASFTAAYATSQSQAAADGYDMHAALQRDVEGYDTYVKADAQVDFHITELMMGDLIAKTNFVFSDTLNTTSAATAPMPVVTLSQYNNLRALTGLDPITLGNDEYLIWSDFNETQQFYRAFMQQNNSLEFNGLSLRAHSSELETVAAETSTFPMNTGALIIADSLLPAGTTLQYSTLNVMYNGTRAQVEIAFTAALDTAFGENSTSYGSTPGWPFSRVMTAQFAYDQAAGLTTVIAYLAIYIGFVLLIACAAILALQQLSEAADSMGRYALLEKIGAEQHMVNKALFMQIGIYFLFPLLLAICHSIVALSVVTDVVELFGMIDIAQPLIITVVFSLVIYGGYFLITYFASRGIIGQKAKRAY